MGNRGPDRVAAVRRMVAAHLPGGRVDSVVPVGEGTDHLAYEVNGELIMRWSREPDPAARAAGVDREARLLAAVAAISPLPVPEPTFTVPGQGVLAYPKLPGRPLLDLPEPRRSAHGTSVAATLGELLAALHAAPTERLAALVDVDDQPPAAWRREAARAYATVAGAVPAAHRRPVEAFLEAPPPAGGWTNVFSQWAGPGPGPTIPRPSPNAPPSTPGAPSSRTWHTASGRGGTPTSTRASPRWRGCSRPSDQEAGRRPPGA